MEKEIKTKKKDKRGAVAPFSPHSNMLLSICWTDPPLSTHTHTHTILYTFWLHTSFQTIAKK